jgi:hypothetical protein
MSLLTFQGTVEPFTVIRRERRLPRPGEVLKALGQSVGALDVVARARVPQDHHIFDVTQLLSVPADEVGRYLLKRPGDQVEQHEPIAARRAFAGLRRFLVRSPVEGQVVETGNGIIILEGEPAIVEIKASIPGSIVESMAPWGVVVETEGTRVHLAWGVGEIGYSELRILTPDEDGLPNPGALDDMEHRGIVVSVAAPLTEAFLHAAAKTSVGGVIGASMNADLVPLVEELGLTVGLTEGFGQLSMSSTVAELLQLNARKQVTLDPGSMEGWRISRPEIIIPLDDDVEPSVPLHGEPLDVNHRVRVLRGPHRGAIGRVVALRDSPQHLPSGLRLVGAEIEVEGGQMTFAPFANLEHLG